MISTFSQCIFVRCEPPLLLRFSSNHLTAGISREIATFDTSSLSERMLLFSNRMIYVQPQISDMVSARKSVIPAKTQSS